MPRSTDEILAHADELARRFEDYEPGPEDPRDARAAGYRRGLARVAGGERDLAAAVSVAALKATPGPRSARCSVPPVRLPGSGTARALAILPAVRPGVARAPAPERIAAPASLCHQATESIDASP